MGLPIGCEGEALISDNFGQIVEPCFGPTKDIIASLVGVSGVFNFPWFQFFLVLGITIVIFNIPITRGNIYLEVSSI